MEAVGVRERRRGEWEGLREVGREREGVGEVGVLCYLDWDE